MLSRFKVVLNLECGLLIINYKQNMVEANFEETNQEAEQRRGVKFDEAEIAAYDA